MKLDKERMGVSLTCVGAPAADDPVLTEMVRRLVDVYHPERIILFGSAARGDAGPDSDYDLMIVVPDDTPPELRRSRWGYRAVADLAVAADLFVSTTGNFQAQLPLRASFPSAVLDEGKILYGA